MASIYERDGRLRCRIKGHDGRWIDKATGCAVGQEAEAERYAKTAQSIEDAKRRGTSAADTSTVSAFAEPWIEDRKKLDLDWRHDRTALVMHVLPHIGRLRVGDVRTPQIVDLFKHIRTTPLESTGKSPAPRTVRNIYSVVSALFRDAKLAGKIDQTPCCLDARQLGTLRDADPEWRAGALFTRDEVQTIISTPTIPWDRRMVYALELLMGGRTGEVAALRWRHYDSAKQPLGEMLVAHSYDSREHRVKGTKTNAVRHVPVHPTLAAMLAEWRLSGWAAMMGRQPEPDDLIVPLPPAAAAARTEREGEPFRDHNYSGKQWRNFDEPALGWRHRRHYDTRATFITLTLEDGASREIIETRVTHTRKRRGAFDGYNRGLQWAATCAEVAKLQIRRLSAVELAVVVPFPTETAVRAGGLER